MNQRQITSRWGSASSRISRIFLIQKRKQTQHIVIVNIYDKSAENTHSEQGIWLANSSVSMGVLLLSITIDPIVSFKAVELISNRSTM